MPCNFRKTAKQAEAVRVLSDHIYTLLYGGSRSGKTAIIIFAVIVRAVSKKSRHAILRFRFNDVKTSIGMDTLPKVLEILNIPYELNKSDWVYRFTNGSEIWLGGLDDKQRVEKILGREYSTIYINEASQVSYHAYSTALTRLAENSGLNNKMFIDCNPPEKGHWLYQIFVQHQQPDSELPLRDASIYGSLLMNPKDNPYLPKGYIDDILTQLPDRQKRRFLYGEWLEKRQGALWNYDMIHANRVAGVNNLVRIVIGVDPAVTNNESSDETGIIVAGLGDNNEIYILDDRSVKGSPYEWGAKVAAAYQDHMADMIIGETNQGGDLVESNIRNIDDTVKYKGVRAFHGKYIRAEPVAGMYEMGLVHHVGYFPELEEQLCEWAPGDDKSPDRMDALVYCVTELMGMKVGERQDFPVIMEKRLGKSMNTGMGQSPRWSQSRPPSFGRGGRW